MEQKKRIWVAVVVIENERGDIFIAKRSADRHQGDRWEFPGGKVEPGETDKEALEREIREGLLCKIDVKNKVTTTLHEYDFGFVNLTTFECDLLEGEPVLTEHVAVKWLAVEELATLEWAPADIPAIEILMGQTMG